MLYKQAWQELKVWAIEKKTLAFRRKMNELEKKWAIVLVDKTGQDDNVAMCNECGTDINDMIAKTNVP